MSELLGYALRVPRSPAVAATSENNGTMQAMMTAARMPMLVTSSRNHVCRQRQRASVAIEGIKDLLLCGRLLLFESDITTSSLEQFSCLFYNMSSDKQAQETLEVWHGKWVHL